MLFYTYYVICFLYYTKKPISFSRCEKLSKTLFFHWFAQLRKLKIHNCVTISLSDKLIANTIVKLETFSQKISKYGVYVHM